MNTDDLQRLGPETRPRIAADAEGGLAEAPPTESEAVRLVRRVFAADEARDVEAFLNLLTPDVTFRLGSQPEVSGREAVRTIVSGLFAAMDSISHRLIGLWTRADTIAVRAEVAMTPKGGATSVLPYMNALRVAGNGQLAEYRIHIDFSPLRP